MTATNTSKNPKIMIVTVPLRSLPTDFPPMGSLSVITSLKRAGFSNTQLYHIDLLRPTFEEVIDHLKKKPDILGINVAISNACAFTKRLPMTTKLNLQWTTISRHKSY